MIDQEKIHEQCLSEDPQERKRALDKLRESYSSLPDKQQAWDDLHKLVTDEDFYVRYSAADALSFAFAHVPDKQQAWDDLIKWTKDQNYHQNYYGTVEFEATSILGSAFSCMPDKQQAWDDLNRLIISQNNYVRGNAAKALGFAFAHMPDKQQAWDNLIKLTTDKDNDVRSRAIFFLGSAFAHVPNKQQAWDDLYRLATDKNSYMRFMATSALGFAFAHVPDKQQAWDDLHRLATDEYSDVRSRVASALGFAFAHVPDKQQAWDDLHRLATNEYSDVRSRVKTIEVSDDVYRFATDEYSDARFRVASALGFAFSHVPDKQQAWNDLHKLTNDEDLSVRTSANHSLGKASIFKASQSEKEEDYKEELETAITFFEKAAQGSKYSNPSDFCLPFYRSFYTIIFQKQEEAEEEVDRYLEEAKYAVRGSKNKEMLFETVENLANALKEVQNLENLDLETKKGELDFYRQYCDRAAELMKDTEETAPFATMTVRKGLPILNRNLKELVEEIQKRAKIACKESKGTDTEELACAINREIQTWEIGSQEEMAFNVENLIFTLESNVPRIPENQYIFHRIQQIREQKDVPKQYGIISTIIPLIPKIYMEQKVDELENDIKEIKEKIDYVIISLKLGIKEEIEISVGTEVLGTGVTHKITIPLQEISYSELKEDLEKIAGAKIDRLSKLPKRLANKIKGYLLLHDKDDILEKLV